MTTRLNQVSNAEFVSRTPLALSSAAVPMISIEGSALDCGREYAEIVQTRYPGYQHYLNELHAWRNLSPHVTRLFEKHAPHILDVFRGMLSALSLPRNSYNPNSTNIDDCTSFGLDGSFTADGNPISGQNKDTVRQSQSLYIVLRMRVTGAPTILVLAYPGEVLGYGMWSTGMTLFRNSLHSTADNITGLTKEQYGFLVLAGSSVEDAAELARREGIQGQANLLLSDSKGASLNIESNKGGVDILPAADGLCVHANHPVGTRTIHHEQQGDRHKAVDSRFRERRLAELLKESKGALTPTTCFRILSDHENYPNGLCQHAESKGEKLCTTASVIAKPTEGQLYVIRGNPCGNTYHTYTF